MPATVSNWKAGGYDKQVKNLGWLLRHWKEVICFDVRKVGNIPYTAESGKCIFTAYLCGDRMFRCDFADFTVCRNFLNRPVFAGLPLWWINHETHTNAPCTLLWKKPVSPNYQVTIDRIHRSLWNPMPDDPAYWQ